MQQLTPALALGLVALCSLGPVRTASADEKADAVMECVSQNLPSKSSVQEVILRARDRGDAINESELLIYWQRADDGRSKVMLRFTAPRDMRGSSLLLLEKPERNDIFMYLPEFQKVRRIRGDTVSGSMFGTDFSYEQFQRMMGMAEDAKTERLADTKLDGRTVQRIAHEPKMEEGSQFERVLTYVDPSNCVVLRTEYFEPGERLRKVLEIDPEAVERIKTYWIPRRVVMKDLRDGTATELEVVEIDLDTKIKRKIFSMSELERGH